MHAFRSVAFRIEASVYRRPRRQNASGVGLTSKLSCEPEPTSMVALPPRAGGEARQLQRLLGRLLDTFVLARLFAVGVYLYAQQRQLLAAVNLVADAVGVGDGKSRPFRTCRHPVAVQRAW